MAAKLHNLGKMLMRTLTSLIVAILALVSQAESARLPQPNFLQSCAHYLRPQASAVKAQRALFTRDVSKRLTPQDLVHWRELLLAHMRLGQSLIVATVNARTRTAIQIELDIHRMNELVERLESATPQFELGPKDYDAFEQTGVAMPGQFVVPVSHLGPETKQALETAFNRWVESPTSQ